MDELFDSGIKLAYPPESSFFVKFSDETEASRVQRNIVICPSNYVCLNWATYQKNVSIMVPENSFEENLVLSNFVGENSKPLLCRLEYEVLFHYGTTLIMLYGDPLIRRFTEIIDRVVEAGLYKYWISLRKHRLNIQARKIAIPDPFDG